MTLTKVFCDHCGKVLDNMSDYIDLHIEVCHKAHNVDLCTECFEKLDYTIKDFCTMGNNSVEKAINKQYLNGVYGRDVSNGGKNS